jgi:calcineurin-like phosphoesterase family protein
MKIKLLENQNVWFISDTHYSHANICYGTSNWEDKEYCRKFDSLEEMNQTIVDNINKHVLKNDILFHLGDWSFGGFENIEIFRKNLNCENIYLILGNHDHHIKNNKNNVQSLFKKVFEYLELEIIQNLSLHKYKFVLMHYPIVSWNKLNEGVIHIHGHTHLPKHLKLSGGKIIDVGVDGNDLMPISLNEIIKIMSEREIKSGFNFDHHVKKII